MNGQTCRRRARVLVDCHVEADLSGYVHWIRRDDVERRAKALEDACAELVEFVRDHRSRDPLSLDVIREYKDLCSVCGSEWETAGDGDEMICASCGSVVEADVTAAAGAA